MLAATYRKFLRCQNEIFFFLLCYFTVTNISSQQTVVRFPGKHDCFPAKKARVISPPPRSRERGTPRYPASTVGDAPDRVISEYIYDLHMQFGEYQ